MPVANRVYGEGSPSADPVPRDFHEGDFTACGQQEPQSDPGHRRSGGLGRAAPYRCCWRNRPEHQEGSQKKQRKTGQPDQAGQSGPQIHPHRDPVIGHPPRRGGSQPQGEGKAVEDDRKAESFGEPSHGEAGGGESDRSPQPETAVVEAVSHRVIDGEGVRDGNDGALEEGEGGGGGQQGEVFVKEQEAPGRFLPWPKGR